MLLVLRGKSKDRIEVQWNGEEATEISFLVLEGSTVVGRHDIDNRVKLNLSLKDLNFSLVEEHTELDLIVQAEEQVSKPLKIQKCHYRDCAQWGYVKDDGYCKHCGRRLRESSPQQVKKLEVRSSKITLYNGVKGKLVKSSETFLYDNIMYSLGKYADNHHSQNYVDILEEELDLGFSQRFTKLCQILEESQFMGKLWIPPLACFQKNYNRSLWIYSPSLQKKTSTTSQISAYSYICRTEDYPTLSSRDLLNLGIQLCQIARALHSSGYSWGGVRLADLIISQDSSGKNNIHLRSRDISWKGLPSKTLIDTCLIPWEVYWETSFPLDEGEISEVYVIGAILYLLKARASNLLTYNHITYQRGLPSLKLFRSFQEKIVPEHSILDDYFESVLNQALILHPEERGYQTLNSFQQGMQSLLDIHDGLLPFQDKYILDVGEALDVGDEKRIDDVTTNQDNLFVTTANLERKGWGMFVLCDGISTATVGSGEQASRLIRDTFRDWWGAKNDEEREAVCRYACTDLPKAQHFLNNLVDEANQKIRIQFYHEKGKVEETEDALIMGSTVTAGLIYKGIIVYGWVGDSPMFRFSRLGWERLNMEDNERNVKLLAGKPLEECFLDGGNAITRCVGAHFYKDDTIEMHFDSILMNADEFILVCSDGIPDYIEQESYFVAQENYHMLRLASILEHYKNDHLIDSKALAHILISSANRVGGGYDNLSAILIRTVPYSRLHFGKSYERLRSLCPVQQKSNKNSE